MKTKINKSLVVANPPMKPQLQLPERKHTKLPWMVLHGNPHTSPSEPPCVFALSGTLRIASIHGYLYEDEPNARFIVRACNAHYEMLAALGALVADGKCYCPEHLVVKATCPHCKAVAILKEGTKPL